MVISACPLSTSFHCEIESAWEGASRHQSVDGLCHFCCDSPHPSRAVSAGAACGAGSISQWILVLQEHLTRNTWCEMAFQAQVSPKARTEVMGLWSHLTF